MSFRLRTLGATAALLLLTLTARAQSLDLVPSQSAAAKDALFDDFYWPLDPVTLNIVAFVPGLFGLGAELAYDAPRVSYDDGTLTPLGTVLDDGTTLEPFEEDDDAGTLAFAVTRSGSTGLATNGTITTMRFTVVDFAPPGTATFSLSDILVVNAAGGAIPVTSGSGSFEVGGVWPGDTDNNCTVEAGDVLPIGLHFGETGPARLGGFDLTWSAKAFSPWGGSSSAPDFARSFIDATGDGELDQNDVLPIGVNFGQTHASTSGCTPSALPKHLAGTTLTLAPQPVGSVIEVELASTEAVDALLGASFRVAVDAQVLKVNRITAGALLEDGDLLALVRLGDEAGVGEAAFSRKGVARATSGSGVLAVVELEVVGAMVAPSVIAVSEVKHSTGGGVVEATARLSSDALKVAVEGVPSSFALSGNYPNPFNPETTIRFEVPEASVVQLVVYDVLGRPVRVLVDGTREAGTHEVVFEASGLPSGTYLYRLETPQGSFVQTMQLVK